MLGLAVAGAAAGGSLLGVAVGADAAEPPEQAARASSSVVNTAMKSRFRILSPIRATGSAYVPNPAHRRRRPA